jgi:hypothetical protein
MEMSSFLWNGRERNMKMEELSFMGKWERRGKREEQERSVTFGWKSTAGWCYYTKKTNKQVEKNKA